MYMPIVIISFNMKLIVKFSENNLLISFQIVLQVGEEVDEMVTIRAANNRQAMCPLIYLQEL